MGNIKNIYSKTVILLAFILLMYSVTSYAVSSYPDTRLSGPDRYGTGASISAKGWQNSEYVFLATGEGDDKFADALAGTPAAYALNAPILLTEVGRLNPTTKAEIARLGAKKAVILGGMGVVSKDTESELYGLGVTVERLWGADRYETAVKIAEKIRTINVFTKVILTTGEEFQYAMMAAPFAARKGVPVLFTGRDSLNKTVEEALIKWGVKEVEIVGNNGVIASAVEDKLRAMGLIVVRMGGADIYETNINIVKSYGWTSGSIAIARDDLFADALSGAPLAAKNNMPIFLVGRDDADGRIIEYINGLSLSGIYIFGGTGAVTDGPITAIRGGISIRSLRGNSVGNLINGGYAVLSGEYVYYVNDTDGNTLYKKRLDGTGKVRLNSDKTKDINVLGGWIYYVNKDDGSRIYKIRTDGTGRVRVNDESSRYVSVIDGWIYYGGLEDWKIYKIRTDGTGRALICGDTNELLNAHNGWIYYAYWNEGRKIYKVKYDGTGRAMVVADGSFNINASSEWIYYSNDYDGGKLYKVRTDGSSRTKICDYQTYNINVSGDWIYYTDFDEDYKLYKIKTDGTERTRLTYETAHSINIVGDRIYYTNALSGPGFFSIKNDGTDRVKVD